MTEKTTLTIRLKPVTKEILNLICNVKGVSVNQYLNQLIENKISEVEPATLKEIAKLRDL